MKSGRASNFVISFILKIFIPSVFIFSSCNIEMEDFIYPSNEVVKLYTSPKFDLYSFKKIAVAPMMNDDTTDTGTFYATNHFINELESKFGAINFFIPSYHDSTDSDSLTIRIAESIEKDKHLDLKSFYETDLGNAIMKENADAVFIGIVTDFYSSLGYSYSKSRRFYPATLTKCEFTYYLISLKDGRVLWRAVISASEGYYLLLPKVKYPPLDLAISNKQ